VAVSVLTGHARAAAVLRTVTAVLLLLNLIPTGLLFLELRETLSRIYRDQQVHLALALTIVGGALIPLILLLVGDGAPWILAALLFILGGNPAIRSRFLKIPHASHESRSGGKA